jgi:hypothetical protein
MPFGYSDAPRAFTRLMKVIAERARSFGLRIVVYLDDILIMSHSRESCEADTKHFLSILEEFGLAMNAPKSMLNPSQKVKYLGTLIDSVSMMFFLPPDKVAETIAMARALLKSSRLAKPVHREQLRKAVGKLQAARDCVLPTRIHINALIHDLAIAEANRSVWLSEHSAADLQWWIDALPSATVNGRPIRCMPTEHVLTTDASETGWGAVYRNACDSSTIECHGRFPAPIHDTDPELTSNRRELTAILNAVLALSRRFDWRDTSVLIRTDNQVSMAYVNRMGGRTPELCRIIESLMLHCIPRNITLRADYIPGADNTAADRLSRIKADWSSAQLNPSIYRDWILPVWGHHHVDCFASAVNRQPMIPMFVSLKQDVGSLFTDFLTGLWPTIARQSTSPAMTVVHPNLWLYPPYVLIERTLAKALDESVRPFTMIVPFWPAAPWWPTLLSMLVDWPIFLPQIPNLLTHPELNPAMQNDRDPPSPKWQTIGVRLSGAPWRHAAWIKWLSICSSKIGKAANPAPHAKNMPPYGANGRHGAPTPKQIHSIFTPLASETPQVRYLMPGRPDHPLKRSSPLYARLAECFTATVV